MLSSQGPYDKQSFALQGMKYKSWIQSIHHLSGECVDQSNTIHYSEDALQSLSDITEKISQAEVVILDSE